MNSLRNFHFVILMLYMYYNNFYNFTLLVWFLYVEIPFCKSPRAKTISIQIHFVNRKHKMRTNS